MNTKLRSFFSRERNLLITIFLLSFAIRFVFVLVGFENTIPPDDDQHTYDNFAIKMKSGLNWLDKPASHRPPVYPAFLAVVYLFFGHNYIAVRIIQAILGALTSIVIYFLAKRIFNKNVAIIAALISVIHYHLIYYTGLIMRETLITLLLMFVIISLYRMHSQVTFKSILLPAILLTTLFHTDPRYLAYLPFIFIWMLILWQKKSKAILNYSLLIVIICVSLIPWTIRNYIAYDKFVLINERTLQRKIPILSDIFPSLPQGVGAERAKSNQKDVNATLPQKQPSKFPGFTEIIFSKGKVHSSSNFVVNLMLQSIQFYKTGYHRISPESSLDHNFVRVFWFVIIIPFFILGMITSVLNIKKDALILLLPVVAQTLIQMLQWARPRYRVPVEPYIIIFVAYGMIWFYQRIHQAVTSKQLKEQTEW